MDKFLHVLRRGLVQRVQGVGPQAHFFVIGKVIVVGICRVHAGSYDHLHPVGRAVKVGIGAAVYFIIKEVGVLGRHGLIIRVG